MSGWSRLNNWNLNHGIVLLGDSITDDCRNEAAASYARGYWTWLDYALGSPFGFSAVVEAGVGGDDTGEMLARISADVLAQRARYVLVLGGTNDVLAPSLPSATSIANLQAIYSAILATGAHVIGCTVPPATSIDTAGERTAFDALNAWIRAFSHPRFILADTALSYRGADDYTPLANATRDGVHPSDWGAMLLGQTIATAMAPLGLRPHTFNATDNAIANMLSAGTSGSPLTGATGDVADGWRVYANGGATVTCSKVDRGALGQWQQIALSGPANSFWEYQYRPTGLVVGEVWDAWIELETADWTDIQKVDFRLWSVEGGDIKKVLGHVGGDPEIGTHTPGVGIASLRGATIPVGAATFRLSVRVYVSAGGVGSATVRAGRCELRKVA